MSTEIPASQPQPEPEITPVEPVPKPKANPGSRSRQRELDWKEGRVNVIHLECIFVSNDFLI